MVQNNESELPGKEIPKEYREVVAELVRNQGWRYDPKRRHPVLYPEDRSQSPMTVPSTPSDRRGLLNFLTDVRKRGGKWPPERK